jgi:hypothetical protein
MTLLKGHHLDVVGGPSTPHDLKSDAGGSLSSWPEPIFMKLGTYITATGPISTA